MILFIDQFTNCDFCYLHPVRGLLGETWLASIELEGSLDDQGMICDFGVVKSTARRLLDEKIDHCLLVPRQSAHLRLEESATHTALQWTTTADEHIIHQAPAACVTLVDAGEITGETVSAWCAAQLERLLPGAIDAIRVRFTPETISGSFYHYSHGLKKHAGKCQRIAHGHRSKIEIWRDGERATVLERRWAEMLRDSYIGSAEDLVPEPGTEGYRHFRYRAGEGEFYLQLPARHCHLLDTESTVEHIAAHIARQLKQGEPERSFRVRAYEGLAKGAMVTI